MKLNLLFLAIERTPHVLVSQCNLSWDGGGRCCVDANSFFYGFHKFPLWCFQGESQSMELVAGCHKNHTFVLLGYLRSFQRLFFLKQAQKGT